MLRLVVLSLASSLGYMVSQSQEFTHFRRFGLVVFFFVKFDGHVCPLPASMQYLVVVVGRCMDLVLNFVITFLNLVRVKTVIFKMSSFTPYCILAFGDRSLEDVHLLPILKFCVGRARE